ncbi:LAMI_0D03796g1_1 [Lachancea mirantina]|uniref:NADPH--cytochrome P450 reductase n=1 Tax=Lachancea mirantina TaxID=1230905 RepID=A0A1G4JA69_9SACH|nr:LAMI_0D03796g1_1 [Lachancea mirantina]
MPLGLDKLDFAVLCSLALAVLAYFSKSKIQELLSSDDAIKVNSDSRDVVQVLRENNKNYLVLYGSQTGTAEDYAKKFGKEMAAKFSLNVMCADVENYDLENLNDLPSNVIVSLFISTYGEGDFPDGAIPFEDFLTARESGDLSNVKYTLFGLGNSTYEFFNGAAKRVEKYMNEAGATRVGPFGEADDGAGTTDEDFLTWKDSVMEELKDQLGLDEHEQVFEPSFEYKQISQGVSNEISLGEPTAQYMPNNKIEFSPEGKQVGPFDATHPYVAPITATRELFSSGDRNCIHAEFDLSGSNIKYTTGDHLAIWPSNPDEKIAKFLECFDLDADTVFSLVPRDSTVKLPFPVPTTIGAAVRHYLEITGPVSRQFIASLVQFAPKEDLKVELTELSRDRDFFAKEVTVKYLDLADALLHISHGAKWGSVPWNFLVESVPRLQPRYYSISSSSLTEKQVVHVTAVVENFPNPSLDDHQPVTGVTTNLLRNLQLAQNKEDIQKTTLPVHFSLEGPRGLFKGYKLPVHVRRSTFRLPSNTNTPVIMIGPGTGVAPFRGFVRERVKLLEKQPNTTLGKHLLFYGSRNTSDFLYQEEWPDYSKKLGDSFEMIVAHSRLENKSKVYVQDKLIERKDEIYDLVKNKGAFIYVCGDAKGMAQSVHAAFVKILSEGSEISTDDATAILKAMKPGGRYQEDVW